MRKIKFGIIGCGVISDWHAGSIKEIENAELIAVTDINQAAAEKFAQKYSALSCESVEKLLSLDIDAVCICTPSGLHAQLAVSAADAGKHIVLEKPIGITTQELDDIDAACERNHVYLAAVSQFLFSDAMNLVKQTVDSGELGKLILGDITMKFLRTREYYQSATWRGTWKMDGGGALMNQGIHGIGMLLHIMGPVKSVTAYTRTLTHTIEVEDTAVAILEFQNGALGHIVGTTSIYPGFPRVFQVSGDQGTITLTEDQITGWQLRSGRQEQISSAPIINTSSNPTSFSIDGHKRQITDFVNAIIENRAPLVNQLAGRQAVDLVLAIYESSKTGKTIYLK